MTIDTNHNLTGGNTALYHASGGSKRKRNSSNKPRKMKKQETKKKLAKKSRKTSKNRCLFCRKPKTKCKGLFCFM